MQSSAAWQIVNDFSSADISPKDHSMLCYAQKLTLSPQLVKHKDIDALSKKGFSQSQILLINLTASYFNFVNRLALGLGVQIEDYWDTQQISDLQNALTD